MEKIKVDNMIELNQKYVLHVPLYKFINGELIEIEIDEILVELINRLNVESLYMTKVKSAYKKRIYDEILITIFTSQESPIEEFNKWFRQNNDVLCQEAFAYEFNNTLIIEKLNDYKIIFK